MQMEKISNYIGSKMPETLGEARGKVVLLSRFANAPAGVHLYVENPGTTGLEQKISDNPAQRFHIQDLQQYKDSLGRTDIADASKTKFDLVKQALSYAADTNAHSASYVSFVFNYASAVCNQTGRAVVVIPVNYHDTYSVSDQVQSSVAEHLKAHPNDKTGFLIFNFITPAVAFMIFKRNLGRF